MHKQQGQQSAPSTAHSRRCLPGGGPRRAAPPTAPNRAVPLPRPPPGDAGGARAARRPGRAQRGVTERRRWHAGAPAAHHGGSLG